LGDEGGAVGFELVEGHEAISVGIVWMGRTAKRISFWKDCVVFIIGIV
jgi:hypothetical protein